MISKEQGAAIRQLSNAFNVSLHSIIVAITIADERKTEDDQTEHGQIALEDIAKLRDIVNAKQ
jgi:hypothetical protein